MCKPESGDVEAKADGELEADAQAMDNAHGAVCNSSSIATKTSGFERALQLVGGHGRFQWLAMCVIALQLVLLTWNPMGYIFMGAVPQHWCHLQSLENSSWSLEQIKNISIPKLSHNAASSSASSDNDEQEQFKYDQCQYYDMDYNKLLEDSERDFELAYKMAHHEKTKTLQTNPCTEWSYDNSIYSSTIVSEFNLVCGRRYLVASIQAFYMIGAFVGTLTFGPLDDKILGRRNSALVGIVLIIFGGFITSFATSYMMFIACRFLVAIGTAGCMQATSIWFLEHCDTKCRAKMYCISGLFFGVGYAIMPLYAYTFRTWSHLQLAFTLTHLSLVSFFWIFPESPRWLASHGRDSEAVAALERMARLNRVPPPQRADLVKAVQQCHHHHHRNKNSFHPTQEERKKGKAQEETSSSVSSLSERNKGAKGFLSQVAGCLSSFKTLLSTKELAKISCTVWILFVSVAFVYYGFAFSTNLTSNPFLLVSLGALMEIPAALLPVPFLSRWGRRPTLVTCYLFTGLASLFIALTPSSFELARTCLLMIGKLFVASAYTVVYLVVSEVYPTVVRTTGQGAGSLMGRFGSISAPYVADLLTTVYPDLPCVIFGIVALTGAFVSCFIPEMKDEDMKDQVDQFRHRSSRKKNSEPEF